MKTQSALLVSFFIMPAMKPISRAPTPMSPAGTSVSAPTWRNSSLHESLAEAHHLARALALGVEVGAALAAAHGQRGQRVLEGLLEGEELQDRQVHRGVEAHAALVGADGRAVLDAVAAVDLHLAVVVHPGRRGTDDALGLDQAVQQAVLGVLRVARR